MKIPSLAAVFTPLLCTLALLTAPVSMASADTTQATLEDNPRVVLHPDGRWSLTSDERYAVGADGQRYRLSADGSWEAAGQASVETRQRLRNRDQAFSLQEVVVETHKQPPSGGRKIPRINTRTEFHILARRPADSDVSQVALQKKDIQVIDNRGKEYKVLRVEPQQFELNAEQPTELRIRVDESLRWGASAMTLTIPGKIFGREEDVVMVATPYDMTQVESEGF